MKHAQVLLVQRGTSVNISEHNNICVWAILALVACNNAFHSFWFNYIEEMLLWQCYVYFPRTHTLQGEFMACEGSRMEIKTPLQLFEQCFSFEMRWDLGSVFLVPQTLEISYPCTCVSMCVHRFVYIDTASARHYHLSGSFSGILLPSSALQSI